MPPRVSRASLLLLPFEKIDHGLQGEELIKNTNIPHTKWNSIASKDLKFAIHPGDPRPNWA